MTRQAFEEFLAAPPYEKSIARWQTNTIYHAWPGQYRDYAVQLAWEVLVEAKRRKQEREAKL